MLDALLSGFFGVMGFIKWQIGLFFAGLAATGYLLRPASALNSRLLFVVASVFFLTAAIYAYNQIIDKREDRANKLKINPLAQNKTGYVLVAFFFILGIAAAVFLSNETFLLALIIVTMGIAYSFLRLKKLYPFKNFLTAAGLSIFFLFGATAAGSISEAIISAAAPAYVLAFFLLFILSFVGDLRDFRGDSLAGIKTIPTVLGYEKSKMAALFLLLAFALFLFLAPVFVPAAMFIAAMALLIYDNRPATAHLAGLLIFMIMPIILFFLKIVNLS